MKRKERWKMCRGYAGWFMKATKANEMGRLMHHDEQELLIVWEGWHWDDNKGGRVA